MMMMLVVLVFFTGVILPHPANCQDFLAELPTFHRRTARNYLSNCHLLAVELPIFGHRTAKCHVSSCLTRINDDACDYSAIRR